MKKILFACSAAFLFQLSQDVYAQLSERETQERCENNKKRLAELEDQLKTADIRLLNMPERKQIEKERTDMIEVKKIILHFQKKNFDPDYNIYAAKLDEYIGKYSYSCNSSFPVCANDLYHTIARKIDREEEALPQKAQLQQTRADLEKQITAHKNNLIALGCNDVAGPPPSYISGTWKSDWGDVQLTAGESAVSGFWMQGDQKGEIAGGSFKNNRLRFSYYQTWNKASGTADFILTESATGYTLSGSWQHKDGPGGSWTMTKNK